ncbi:phosphogluconate dehydrogenase C-terminal domain-containing protein [Botrimarina sp.]|uniref:phosphogluconate dehydrogenase C-terminal domain-containing protein n=1 Tax=Botrimarina sp. TaxID=2795802 RepID=UPI0032EB6787
MAQTIALLGAAGKMGTRISKSLSDNEDYRLLCVEADAAGRERLIARCDEAAELEQAVPRADIVILAVPDRAIRSAAPQAVELMRSGAMIVALDPAGPHAGLIPDRGDISVFVCHPAHPSVFNEETDIAARFDFFGSGKARQAIVCALMRGDESDYESGERLARAMWKPITRAHRVTVEQMAMLEPVLSETVAATCIAVIREAMDEAVRRGVPEPAARDFLLGHIYCELAVLFDRTEFPFSDGALAAIEDAKKTLFRDDWKQVFEPDAIQKSVERITGVAKG